MAIQSEPMIKTVSRDLVSGLVVFLVALPLCLGVALASGAPLLSGLLAGIVGGVLAGAISGSHSSVSGPAAGLTAVVAIQIQTLGSFDSFLLVVMLAGLIQIVLGVARLGLIAEFVPSSVIKGLLAAIGTILIIKQAPLVVGYKFLPLTEETGGFSLTEFLNRFHIGSAILGVFSLIIMESWSSSKVLKKSIIPAPLIVVLFGVALSSVFRSIGGVFVVDPTRLVQVPVSENLSEFLGFLQQPDFSQLGNTVV